MVHDIAILLGTEDGEAQYLYHLRSTIVMRSSPPELACKHRLACRAHLPSSLILYSTLQDNNRNESIQTSCLC